MEKFTSQTFLTRQGADFESQESFNNHSVIVSTTAKNLKYSGMPLDWLGNGEYATSSKEMNCMIVGDTGCGKTRRLIIPTIKLLSKTGQSMIISDPKGELFRKTSNSLKSKGYEVKVINMRDPRRGDRWNPFTRIDKLFRSEDQDLKDRALLLLDEILDILRRANHSERDPYWENSATQYLKAICLMILEYGEPGMLSFHNMSLAESRMSKMLSSVNDNELGEFLEKIGENTDIYQNMHTVLSVVDAKPTLDCIISMAHTMVTQYTRQESVRYLFSESDFNIESIGEVPMVVYMVIPDDSEALYPLATLFVDQVYSAMIDLAYRKGGVVPNHVNFVLDEFANFTRMPKIRSMLTAARSRGMRFFLVVQDVDQLEEQYGENAASIVMSNCHVWIYMGSRNLLFLRTLKEISGFRTEKYTGNTYPLLDLNDLLTLQIGETIVWNKGCNPKRCWLPDYSEVNFGSEEREADFPETNPDCSLKNIDINKIISENSGFTFTKVEEDDDESIIPF